jgi:hypothetical protein
MELDSSAIVGRVLMKGSSDTPSTVRISGLSAFECDNVHFVST